MNKILNLIFKTDTTDATQELNKFKGEVGSTDTGAGGTGVLGVTSALKASIAPALALGTSLMGVGYILKGELDKYTDYITEVSNLASSLDITAEEASYLYDAMDRSDISAATMIGAFRRMTTEGIDPTLENLQDLLFEYDKLEGIDKSAFANEMFGPAGVKEIIPWWESLTELQKERLGYQETGLKVTQDIITETQELETTTALLTTEWDMLKGQLVEGVMPTLITIGQYIYISMEYSKRLRNYLAGLKIPYSGAPKIPGLPGYDIELPDPKYEYKGPGDRSAYAAGGSFTVGGSGGSDSMPVGFMATPGETVSIGGGTSDMENILSEIRRLVDSLPVAIADAVERR